MKSIRRALALAVLATAALGATATVQPAAAWRGGVFFGFAPVPFFAAPPPVYYPPPYYPSPYYAAPVYAAPPAPERCFAGPFMCPLDAPATTGGPCSCPANNGRVFGRAG